MELVCLLVAIGLLELVDFLFWPFERAIDEEFANKTR